MLALKVGSEVVCGVLTFAYLIEWKLGRVKLHQSLLDSWAALKSFIPGNKA